MIYDFDNVLCSVYKVNFNQLMIFIYSYIDLSNETRHGADPCDLWLPITASGFTFSIVKVSRWW